jgi:hypothetical protein
MSAEAGHNVDLARHTADAGTHLRTGVEARTKSRKFGN